MSKSNFLLAMLLFLFVGLPLAAQESDGDDYPYPDVREDEYKDYVKDKFHDQQDQFLDNKFMYPAPPKNQWELGIDVGGLWISGDIKSSLFPGFGIGGHVRKSFGYVFSVRGSFMTGTTKGANWQGSNGWNVEDTRNAALAGGSNYDALNGDFATPNYVGQQDILFFNYKTRVYEAVVSGVVNLNNIKFHKRRNKFSYHTFAGIGGLLYNTKMDQLDSNGDLYDYDELIDRTDGSYSFDENRREFRDALNDLWDGEYESQAEKHFDDYWFFGAENDVTREYSYRPTAHIGLGAQYKITNRINIGLESKVTYTNDDLLDGQRWQEWGALTRDYDTYVFTNLSLNINLGAGNTVEPLWWMNPLDYSYDELDECHCDIPEPPDFTDTDGDGVPDLWDEEPNSPCKVVNTRGIATDSDGDGVLDCNDQEPYTHPNSIGNVDENGVAIEGDPCDKFKDCIPPPINIVPNCEDSYLPNVLFNSGSAKVRDEFAPQLSAVAEYLRNNRDARLCVVGHTDASGSPNANNCISYKRAESIVNKLVTDYGIPRTQLIIQYRGANEPVIAGAVSGGSGKGKAFDAPNALNRRVDFKCCMEGQYDMPRPAGCR